jgi:hypothetical protein
MKNTLNVLIFPCGSENACEIWRSLKSAVNVKLFGANSKNDHSEFLYDRVHIAPSISNDTFESDFKALVNKLDIDIIFPTHDDVALKLASMQFRKAKVATSSAEANKVCRDKRITHQRFSSFDFVLPLICGTPEIYPVFAKPTHGQGGVGNAKIHTTQEWQAYVERSPSAIVTEFLSGPELTVDCLSDKNGLRGCFARTRERTLGGITTRSSPALTSYDIMQIATIIQSELKMRGVWYFQLKANDKGNWKLLEISARAPGGLAITRAQGVNLPLLACLDLLDEPFEVPIANPVRVVERRLATFISLTADYSHVYIDLDETLTLDGHLNPEAAAFIFSARRKGKRIYLLTRHSANPMRTLEELGLSARAFDGVIHLQNGERKSESITEIDAIFIDNSYAERSEVSAALGIPVFDVDAIPHLCDWRI